MSGSVSPRSRSCRSRSSASSGSGVWKNRFRLPVSSSCRPCQTLAAPKWPGTGFAPGPAELPDRGPAPTLGGTPPPSPAAAERAALKSGDSRKKRDSGLGVRGSGFGARRRSGIRDLGFGVRRRTGVRDRGSGIAEKHPGFGIRRGRRWRQELEGRPRSHRDG